MEEDDYVDDPFAQERWVTIEEAPDYEVSDHYHVRRKTSGRPVKLANPNYRRIVLMVDGDRVSFSIDQLVVDHFGERHIDYNERWRQCERAWNYSVSSNGRIRNDQTGRILKPFQTRSGGLQVTLSDDGHRLTIPVRILIQEAFG